MTAILPRPRVYWLFLPALAGACFLSAATKADFTITPSLMRSAGALGNVENSVYMYTYTGPEVIVNGSTFTAGCSGIAIGTLASEAQWNIRNTRFGTSGSVSFQVTGTGVMSGTVLIAATRGGGMILRPGDVLRLETFESYDDAPGDDAIWTDVHWTFHTATIEDLGHFSAVTSMRTSGGPGFGTDTEIALFDSSGVLLRSNDDFGGTSGSGFDGLSLAEGAYYLTVTPYNSTFANGLIRPGFAGTGDFVLAFDGTTVESAALTAYNALLYRFTIGAVASCVADVDDGSGTGTPDRGVTIDDLLYYLRIFEDGMSVADVDDGSGTGTTDGGVTIDDLLYFLLRFESGC